MRWLGQIISGFLTVAILAMPTLALAQFGKPGGFGGGPAAGGFGNGFAVGNAGKANGNGNGNGGGNGNGNANGNSNGGGPPGAPMPALGATLVGQGFALAGGYLLYRRRRARSKEQAST